MFESLLWEVRGLFESFKGSKLDEYLGAKDINKRMHRRRVRVMQSEEIENDAKLLEMIGEDIDCDLLAELIIQAKDEGIPLEDSDNTYKAICESFCVTEEVAKTVVITDKLLSYIKNLDLDDEDLQLIGMVGEALSQIDEETGIQLDADTIAENLNITLQSVLQIKDIIENFQKENATMLKSLKEQNSEAREPELEKPFTIDTTGDTSQTKSQAKTNNNKRRGQQQQQKEAPVAASVAQ